MPRITVGGASKHRRDDAAIQIEASDFFVLREQILLGGNHGLGVVQMQIVRRFDFGEDVFAGHRLGPHHAVLLLLKRAHHAPQCFFGDDSKAHRPSLKDRAPLQPGMPFTTHS